MKKTFYRELKIGVLGGGQLGRMLIQAGIDLNLDLHFLDPSPQAPAAPYAPSLVTGSLTDYATVRAFGSNKDLITVEIENVNTDALADLKAEGKTVYPDPKILRLIQDKGDQKTFYQENDIPTAPFRLLEEQGELYELDLTFPKVLKLRREGYDGRGVHMLHSGEDLDGAFDAPTVLEEKIDFEKEISVIVARRANGETAVFPAVEMVFHPEHNLVEYLFAPAQISEAVRQEAERVALSVVEALDFVGLLAVEQFVTKDGRVLVNEIAPRPHNSGHQTIRANATSQYEQHLRAILDLPLGDTRTLCPAAMVNLLGAPGEQGPAVFEGIEEILAMPGVYPHIYGKAETRPQRKMGHVILLADTVDELRERVEAVRRAVRVVAG